MIKMNIHLLFSDIAANNVKIQMKTFGSLDEYLTFSKIEILLKMKNDFTPINLKLESAYKTKKFLEIDCTQSYEMIFSDVNNNVEIPNLDTIKGQF